MYPSPTKLPGVAQQTVYTPRGGLTVLVGTGNILFMATLIIKEYL